MATEEDKAQPARRIHTAFRITEHAATWLDSLAADYRLKRSVVMRACLAVARKHEAEVRRVLKDWEQS